MKHSRQPVPEQPGPDMGAGAGADAGAAGANPYGDDVVDGDYKEV